ncbi:MAG: CapA family protein [Acidiferrobacterales bacterium]
MSAKPANTLSYWFWRVQALCLIVGVCMFGVACTTAPALPTPATEAAKAEPPAVRQASPGATDTGATDKGQAPVGPAAAAKPPQTAAPGAAVPPRGPSEPRDAAKPKPRRLRIAAVGDIMLGGSAAPELARRGYAYPFVHTRPLFQQSDVVFGNLEGPLTNAGEPEPGKRYVFRSPPEKVAPALAAAGFNLVSLANNHSMDYGVAGLRETLTALDAAGIKHAGAGMNRRAARQPAFISAGGHVVALLAYSLTFPDSFWARHDRPGTAFGHERHVRADVAAARQRADVVVVSFHWGREVTTELRPYQPSLAHAAIDAGALVVLGHHPHVLQAIERYKQGIIFYSLGNFSFGSYSRNATRSIVARLLVEDGRLTELQLIPINVNNVEVVFQPQILYAHEAGRVLEELQRLSEPLHVTISNQAGIGMVRLSEVPDQPLFSKANAK